MGSRVGEGKSGMTIRSEETICRMQECWESGCVQCVEFGLARVPRAVE